MQEGIAVFPDMQHAFPGKEIKVSQKQQVHYNLP